MQLTNLCIRKDIQIMSGFKKEETQEDIQKAHIKEHQMKTKSGKIVTVKEHDDKRQKKEAVKENQSKESKIAELQKEIKKQLNILEKYKDTYSAPNKKRIEDKVKSAKYEIEYLKGNSLNEKSDNPSAADQIKQMKKDMKKKITETRSDYKNKK
jgi:hypothetical protein